MSEKTIKELREARDATWAAYLAACKMAPEAVAQAWEDFVGALQALASAGTAMHRSTPLLGELHEVWMMAEERAMETGGGTDIAFADQARGAYYTARAAAESPHGQ